jgi:pilus assembly protein CpaE
MNQAVRHAVEERSQKRSETFNLSAHIFVRDPQTESAVRQSLYDLNVENVQAYGGDAKTAAKFLAKTKSPDVLVVDICGLNEPMSSLGDLAQVCDPETHVLVVGEQNDIHFYRDIRTLGVVDYFPKPLARDVLNRAFSTIIAPSADRPAHRHGKLMFVVGVRGGCGATTIAAMSAWEMSETRRQRTLLLDLSLQCGDAALLLNATPAYALREAFEFPERVDRLYLERATKQVSDRLDLLAALEPLTQAVQVDADSVAMLLEKLTGRYRNVLVDLPATLAIKLKDILQLPSTCLFVSGAGLSSARDLARWYEMLGPNTAERNTVHVLNHPNAHGGLSLEEFSKVAGRAPDVIVSYDRNMAEAATLGIDAIRTCQSFKRQLDPVLESLTGVGTNQKSRSSLLTKLWGRS